MQNKCCAPQVVYEVVRTNNTDEKLKIYYSLTETTFKEGTENTKPHLITEIAFKTLNYRYGQSRYGH